MIEKIKSLFIKNRGNGPKSVIGFEDYNKQRSEKTINSFCQAPSINMYFSWEGKVIACCFNQRYIIGHYPEQSIDEIWNSEKIKELRESLKKYDLSNGCSACKNDLINSNYTSSNALRFDEYQIGDYPKMMEFQLGNTCNLACVMCNEHLSSTIRKNRAHLPPLPMKYDAAFVKQLEPYIAHLKFTNFSGGEPFLIDIYYDIWDLIVAKNPTCIIKITTNATVLNNRVKNLLQIGNFDITISLDSLIPEKYEAIRIGANFNRVMENIAVFSDYCNNNTRLNINFCPMADNWEEIPNFFEFCNKINASIYFSIVYDPYNKSIQRLSIQELHAIISQTEQKITDLGLNQGRNYHEWIRLKNQINKWIANKTQQQLNASVRVDELIDVLKLKINLLEANNLITEQDYLENNAMIENLALELNNGNYYLNSVYTKLQNMSSDEFATLIRSGILKSKDLLDKLKI